MYRLSGISLMKKILFFFLIGGEKRDRARKKEGGCEAKFEKGMVGGNCALKACTRGRRPNMA